VPFTFSGPPTKAHLQGCLGDIAELRKAVAELRRSPPAVIPSGAVMAFLRTDPSRICPQGWAPLTEAAGRFVIGAGGTFQASTPATIVTGGQAGVSLSVTVNVAADGRHGSDVQWGSTPWGPGPNPAAGGQTAAGKSSELPLPPYIVLDYCKKQ